MKFPMTNRVLTVALSCLAFLLLAAPAPARVQTNSPPEIRTPKPPASPRINGPAVFGVRPGSPVIYHIPATGDRPMEFSSTSLPAGFKLDSKSGDLTGTLPAPGESALTLRAKNALGSAEKKFKIVVGETHCPDPAHGLEQLELLGQPGGRRQGVAQRPRHGRLRPDQPRLELHQH